MSQTFPNTTEEKKSVNPTNTAGRNIKSNFVWIAIVLLVALVGLIIAVAFLARADSSTTSHIRDILIIVVALESLVIGASLVILIVQLALLLNLLQNEIKPILDSTRATVNTMKGTSAFLSEHAIKPVMNISSFGAGLKRVLKLVATIRK